MDKGIRRSELLIPLIHRLIPRAAVPPPEVKKGPHPMIPTPIAHICQEYTNLLCKARCLIRSGEPIDQVYAKVMIAGAFFLYDHAPYGSLRYLDTIKKIMEIDEHITIPDEILLRASVAVAQQSDRFA